MELLIVVDGMLYDIIGVADDVLKLILITGVWLCAAVCFIVDDDAALCTPVNGEMAE